MRQSSHVPARSLSRSVVLAGFCASFFLFGCENKEDVAVAKAEQCLNSASSSTAMGCVSGLSNYTSQKSYLLRCSALYVKNGLTGLRLLEAFKKLKEAGSGADPTITVMSVLAFGTISDANTAINYCGQSGSISMGRLAEMTKIATIVPVTVGTIPSGGLTEAEMQTAITNFKAQINTMPAEEVADLASTITSAATSFCFEGSSYSDNVVCTNFNEAIKGSTPQQIVDSLMAQLLAN